MCNLPARAKDRTKGVSNWPLRTLGPFFLRPIDSGVFPNAGLAVSSGYLNGLSARRGPFFLPEMKSRPVVSRAANFVGGYKISERKQVLDQ
jgi:hypothetical protein